MRKVDACYELIFSTLNGARVSSVQQAMKLKREGLTKGVPDVLCLVPSYEFHGFCIEFKAEKGRVSKEQKRMLQTLSSLNYAVQLFATTNEAIEWTKLYMRGVGNRKAICAACYKP